MPSRLDTVRSAYETLRKPGGLAILADDFLAPDVELDFSALPDGRVLNGVDAFREFRQDYPWMGHLRVEPEDMVEVQGDRVLVMVRVHSVSPAMDAELEGRFAHLMTFRGDKVTRWQLFPDRGEARRAAGLEAGG